MDHVDKARAWITSHELIEPGTRVIAAVSGGPDSVAMLTILASLAHGMRFELAAAYFDHKIRTDAAREKRLVEKYCAKLSIPLFCGSGDVPAAAKRSRGGIEETARELRYLFLEETALQWQAKSVALGHNRDDQVETVLHHIIRGSGLRGLTGMPVKRGIFIRPVLDQTRDELRTFLRESGIRYAIDPSNRDNRIFRNRLRNRLLPYLRRDFNPSIDESLLRVSENASEGWQTLLGTVEKTIGAVRTEGSGAGKVAVIGLSSLTPLSDHQIYLLVDAVLREHFDIVQDITRKHFDSVKILVKKGSSGKRVELGHGISVHRGQKEIRFARTARGETKPVRATIVIPGEGTYALEPWYASVSVELLPGRQGRALLEEMKKSGRSGKTKGSAFDTVMAFSGFPLRVRQRRAGDRLVPFGMKGSRKLSDIFIDRKIELERRDALAVFEDPGGIIWVPGVIAAESTRVTPATGRVMRVRIDSLPSSGDGRKKRM